VVAALLFSGGCATRPLPPSQAARGGKPGAAVRELQTNLRQIFGAPMAYRGVWGVQVRSLDTGEPLFEQDAGKLMMPASNMKILTLAAAAETLGWDFRYTTTLETSGAIDNGVLLGDLIVRGSGDPTISSRGGRAERLLDEWAAALAAAGIRSIDGRIVGNDQAFDDEGLGAGWAWDYLQYGYAAPVGALEYNENVATLTVAPGTEPGDPAVLHLEPGSGLLVVNRARTGPVGSLATLAYRRHPHQPHLDVAGTVPLGAIPLVLTVAVVNPTVFFATWLKAGLESRGIAVAGPAVDFDDVAAENAGQESFTSPRVLASAASPPLREFAGVLMKLSQNLYAETLLKTVGAARGGLGTVAAGNSVLRELLTAWHVPPDAYIAVDGSGLSRYNYVTADTLTAILERLYRDPRHREAFIATLPIAGRDGTTSKRLRGSRAEGNAVAKTGSISNVRTLSGFVRTRDGEMLVFAILANDFVLPAPTINWIADVAVETMANFTRR
jgi:D-alanyl-D-alanine carboxypeptidase/D-alanyl-D-alanine-endopeptidase (penicillin-binding protein 4)